MAKAKRKLPYQKPKPIRQGQFGKLFRSTAKRMRQGRTRR